MPNDHAKEKEKVEARFGRDKVFWGPEVSDLGAAAAAILYIFGGPAGAALAGQLAESKLKEFGGWGAEAAVWLVENGAAVSGATVYCERINIDHWERPFGHRVYFKRSYQVYVAYRKSSASGAASSAESSTHGRHVEWSHKLGWAIESPQEVAEGGFLSNNNFKAVVQGDGNFVLYDANGPVWASKTDGVGIAPYRLALQADGNLVLYDGAQQAIWASATHGQGKGPYRLNLQSDRNLVLYDSESKALWASNTHY